MERVESSEWHPALIVIDDADECKVWCRQVMNPKMEVYETAAGTHSEDVDVFIELGVVIQVTGCLLMRWHENEAEHHQRYPCVEPTIKLDNRSGLGYWAVSGNVIVYSHPSSDKDESLKNHE